MHKRALVHRLVSLPPPTDDFNNELVLIKQIAFENGFEQSLIEEIIIYPYFH